MNRSSKLSTGTSESREAPDELLGLPACAPCSPAQRERQPDDDALGLVLADELGDRLEPRLAPGRSTTPSGRATVPVGSETATPVRAEP